MANRANVTVEVDPISRIEGHLGVKVTTDASGIITDAKAHGNLWRGFENFLLGREVNDAITFTQRICGVCPVPHGLTATYASDAVLGYSRSHITFANVDAADVDAASIKYGIPPKAVLIRNLVLSAEYLMSSITHFYHLAAPSYVQGPGIPPWTPYFDDSYYAADLLASSSADTSSPTAGILPVASAATKLWDAVIISYVRALRIRRLTFEAGALFAGRMPMTSCFVAGGVTNDHSEDLTARCDAYRTAITEVANFIVNEYVPIALALGALYPAFDNVGNGGGGVGAGLGRYLSWGCFPSADAAGTLVFKGGVVDTTASPVPTFTVSNKAQVYSTFLTGANSVPNNLTEDIVYSRYEVATADTAVYATGVRPYSSATAAYPGDVARTKPSRAKAGSYTYMKAPRWHGKPCEVGPLARMAVTGVVPVDNSTNLFRAGGPLGSPGVGACGLYYDGTGTIRATHIASTIVSGLSNSGLLTAVANYIKAIKGGRSTMDRLRARAIESLVLVQAMIGAVGESGGNLTWTGGWIDELKGMAAGSATYASRAVPAGIRQGWGAVEAPRGALMHQATVNSGKITKYQCIVPTTWNGSPATADGEHGAIESACIGAPFSDAGASFTRQAGGSQTTAGGVEVLRIAQSFDPCIACAVH